MPKVVERLKRNVNQISQALDRIRLRSMVDKRVKACVVIIGNEILSGRTQDLNLAYIAGVLNGRGVTVAEARVIPDVHDEIINTINEARSKHDYVLTTGGIGPTHDDITAECIARAFDVPLVVNETISARIQSRPAPADIMKNRLRMALIPQGAKLIDNLTGGPQGFSIANVYVMAGIPSVLQNMLPTIEFRGGPVVRSCSVTAYMGESEIAQDLARIQEKYADEIELGSYPFNRNGRYGTTLVMRGPDTQNLKSMLSEVKKAIRKRGQEPQEESVDWTK